MLPATSKTDAMYEPLWALHLIFKVILSSLLPLSSCLSALPSAFRLPSLPPAQTVDNNHSLPPSSALPLLPYLQPTTPQLTFVQDISPWSLIWKAHDSLRKHTDKAVYTWEKQVDAEKGAPATAKAEVIFVASKSMACPFDRVLLFVRLNICARAYSSLLTDLFRCRSRFYLVLTIR